MSIFTNKKSNAKNIRPWLLIGFISLSVITTFLYFLSPVTNWASPLSKENVAAPSPTPAEEIQVSEYHPINPNSSYQRPENAVPNLGATFLMAQENGFMNCNTNFISGKNLLVIQNTTHWSIKLFVRRSSGEIEKEIYLEPAPQIWKGIVNFSQGQYELVADGLSQFNCGVTIN